MTRRLRALGVALAALSLGCPPQKPPENPASVRNSLPEEPAKLIERADAEFGKGTPDAVAVSLAAAEKAAAKERSYGALWRGARAAAWLSQEHEGEKLAAGYAEKGRELAREAVKLEPGKVEGHYYRSITAGQYAQARKLGARDALPEVIDSAKEAVRLDSRFDCAGPHRLLGSIYAQAPPPPMSVGDPEEGVKELEKALAFSPECPENQLLYAEALLRDDKLDEAEAAFKKVLDMPADRPEWQHRKQRWRDEADKGLRRISTKRRQRNGGGSPFP